VRSDAGRGGMRSTSPGPAPNSPALPPRTPDSGPPPPRAAETILIQCASDVGPRDRALAALDESLTQELRVLNDQSHQSLLDLRQHLLWINLATFAAIFVGGSLLIGLGLAPLRRLGEAVGRVSESHFHLDYDGPTPPRELQPIIDRLKQALDLLQKAFE